MINRIIIEKARKSFKEARENVIKGYNPNNLPAGDLTPKEMLESELRFAKKRVDLVMACKTINDLKNLGHQELLIPTTEFEI